MSGGTGTAPTYGASGFAGNLLAPRGEPDPSVVLGVSQVCAGYAEGLSTAILPDDSVVVRMPTHTVHVDASARAILVREPSTSSPTGGAIRARFPLEAAERIRLVALPSGSQVLCLDLVSGETLDLGQVPSFDLAMVTARAISDLTQCQVEAAEGSAGHPRGENFVIPRDLTEDESTRPTETKEDNEAPLDEIGVDGLAQTVQDHPLSTDLRAALASPPKTKRRLLVVLKHQTWCHPRWEGRRSPLKAPRLLSRTGWPHQSYN